MPQRSERECRHPRCLNYATANGWCPGHSPSPSRKPEFVRRASFWNLAPNNRKFRRLRESFLVRHPVCNNCKRVAATVLDHITPHRGRPELFWDQRNWQGLCTECHGRKTALEIWGHGKKPVRLA